MQKMPFTHFQDISKRAAKREIVLFGAGNIAAKTVRKLRESYAFIVDNNPNLWDTEQIDVSVRKPEVLTKKPVESWFVIICTTSFIEVAEQLTEMGFQGDQDFIVSPVLNDLRIISELESLQKKMLFSSGFPVHNNPLFGGGIYELIVDGDQWQHQKIYDGTCYGLFRQNEHIIAVDDNRGIIELDKSYNVVRSKQLEAGTRAHGICYSEITECYYIAASYLDQVLIYDKNFSAKGSIALSHKYDRYGEPCHHCNDVCVYKDSLFVSMFSQTGNWKQDVFDGVILEIDIATNRILGPVVQDLWMPHNVEMIAGSLTVLDSLRGELKRYNSQCVGKFPGFSRGLAYDGSYYYIGQSRNRNFSKYLGLSNNISIDASIIVFDEITKVSRSLQLPPRVSEIHSILLIDS